MLNLDDLTGSGEDGRIDWRILAWGALGGEIDRTCAKAGAGAEALKVAPAAGPLMDVLEKPPPPFRRARVRWKLLADASESLSYVGAGAAIVLLEAAGRLCGRVFVAAAATGIFLF
jgi:hypothetical protein